MEHMFNYSTRQTYIRTHTYIYVYVYIYICISNIICPWLPASGLDITSVFANNGISDKCAAVSGAILDLKDQFFLLFQDMGIQAQAG